MKILVIGGGGREHALCRQLSESPSCEAVWCAPGNAGIAQIAECHDVGSEDIEGLTRLAEKLRPDLVVVGPEAPLVAGIADAIRDLSIPVFGPSQMAAQMEGSKAFMKDFCARHGIPTAGYKQFQNADDALACIETLTPPIVVKASGLAAGKGVVIAQSVEGAKNAASEMLSGAAFGEAGTTIVIEEFLDGEEVSYFALCSGEDFLPLGSAQDHKRAFDGDTGPNTGGMGAYSPARLMTEDLEKQIHETMIVPTLKGMAAEGNPFHGVLFAGLMIEDGKARLLEYNVRFGDPECQALMMRIKGDFAQTLMAAAKGELKSAEKSFSLSPDPALCTVMAAQGYPGTYQKGTVIRNLDEAEKQGAVVFHAGTKRDKDGRITAHGGRVLGIAASGKTLQAAHDAVYAAISKIIWPEGFCRRDIGWRALKKDKAA